MIAGIAALGEKVPFRLAFEVGARHVIEQHLVVDREQLARPPGQMRFERRLVDQQPIERAVEAILVDLVVRQLKQIAKRRAPIPVLGDVQLARRLAQPRRDQNGRHLLPGDPFLALRQQRRAQLRQSRAAPQGQRQINVAESPPAFEPNALQPHRRRHVPAAVVEQLRLLRRADQMSGQLPRFKPPLHVEFAKMCDRLLNNPPPDPHAPNQTPVAMRLAVLSPNRVAQIHVPSQPSRSQKKIPKVGTTRPKPARIRRQPFDRIHPDLSEKIKTHPELRKLG